MRAALSDRALPGELVKGAAKLGGESDDNTDCVQLFICRMSPVIWGVQVRTNSAGGLCCQTRNLAIYGAT